MASNEEIFELTEMADLTELNICRVCEKSKNLNHIFDESNKDELESLRFFIEIEVCFFF